MAKKSQIERQKKRARLHAVYASRRNFFKQQIKHTKSVKEKFQYGTVLQSFPRNSSPVRLTNRCIITGRSRGVLRCFCISRLVFREMAHQGLLPGVHKSSW
jgi:small subunit ribosomal protein S14